MVPPFSGAEGSTSKARSKGTFSQPVVVRSVVIDDVAALAFQERASTPAVFGAHEVGFTKNGRVSAGSEECVTQLVAASLVWTLSHVGTRPQRTVLISIT